MQIWSLTDERLLMVNVGSVREEVAQGNIWGRVNMKIMSDVHSLVLE